MNVSLDLKGKMKIGIIGTGEIGSTLTRHFTRLGHDVVIANSRGPETIEDLAKETGAKPVRVSEAPRGRDLVVVTIPEDKVPQLPPWNLVRTEMKFAGIVRPLREGRGDEPLIIIA